MALAVDKISDESQRRIELAQRCSTAYVDDGSEVIIVSGSAGLGMADERSDLDMYVFCEAGKKLRNREDRLSQFGLRKAFETPTSRGSTLERYVLDDLTVDVEVVPKPVVEKVLAAVLCEHDIDPEKQKVVRGLLDAVPIAGADAWEEWCRRLATYPSELGIHMVGSHLRFARLVDMKRRTLDRGDPLAFYSRLTGTMLNSLGSLAGLNHYYLGIAPRILKWTDVHLGRMTNLPTRASERIKAGLREPTDECLEDLQALIGDILCLVDQMVPEVQTQHVRRFLASPL
jgi:hypothetical protein